MDSPASGPNLDESVPDVDTVVERTTAVFRAGFRLSAALLVAGIGLIGIRSESLSSTMVPLDEIVPGVLDGSAASFIALGILAMILTPVVSTVTICLTFFQQGDHRYARLTALVLLILVLSISLSLR